MENIDKGRHNKWTDTETPSILQPIIGIRPGSRNWAITAQVDSDKQNVWAKSFSKIYSLNYHLESHLSENRFPYLCLFQQLFYILFVV